MRFRQYYTNQLVTFHAAPHSQESKTVETQIPVSYKYNIIPLSL